MSSKRKTSSFNREKIVKRICKRSVNLGGSRFFNNFQNSKLCEDIEKTNKKIEEFDKRMGKMEKSIEKIMDFMKEINAKINRVETILDNDLKKDIVIEDLTHNLQCMKLNNDELEYKLKNKKKNNYCFYS